MCTVIRVQVDKSLNALARTRGSNGGDLAERVSILDNFGTEPGGMLRGRGSVQY